MRVPPVEYALGADYATLVACVNQLNATSPRNSIRMQYYEGSNPFKDLGISLPNNLRNLNAALGWNQIAVDSLNSRIVFEGFTLPSSRGTVEDFGLDSLALESGLETIIPQAHTAAAINGCAFVSTSLGDPSLGEPPVIIRAHSAASSTGLWNASTTRLRAFFAVLTWDSRTGRRGEAASAMLLTPTVAYVLHAREGDAWEVFAQPHGLGRVPVEALTYQPRLGKPFGQSRITRAMMSTTDSALRTIVRSEIGAEFFSAPQRYILGVDQEMFTDEDGNPLPAWETLIGRVLALPSSEMDDEGRMQQPSVGQFPQISMQPHSDQFSMWARKFAGEASLDPGALGVISDNPSSAEAIDAASRGLVLLAEQACRGFATAWTRSAVTAVQMRDGLATPPPPLAALSARWRDPSTPSRAAATDSVIKLVGAGALMPDDPTVLESLGWDDARVQRSLDHRARATRGGRLAANRGDAVHGDATEPTVI